MTKSAKYTTELMTRKGRLSEYPFYLEKSVLQKVVEDQLSNWFRALVFAPPPWKRGDSHLILPTLHCLADLRWSSEAILDHWFLPYFMTAALRISSSVLRQMPPLIITRGILAAFVGLVSLEKPGNVPLRFRDSFLN